MLTVRGKCGVGSCTRPEGEALMVLRGQDDVLCSGIAEDLCPLIRIPFLTLLIEGCYEIVVVIVGAVVFAMIGLRGRAFDTHGVVVPLGIGVVLEIVFVAEVMLWMLQGCPSWHRVQAPVNEDSEFLLVIPLRQPLLVQRGKR